MRRAVLTPFVGACFVLIFGAGPATAQSSPAPDQPSMAAQDPTPNGTAFTGGSERIPVLIGVGALVLGSSVLLVARRRARLLSPD